MIAAALIAAALVGIWLHGAAHGKAAVQEKLDAEKIIQEQAVIAARAEYLAKERAMAEKIERVNYDKQENEKTLKSAVAASRAESGRLRDNLAALRAGLPALAADALHDVSAACTVVFSECSERYSELAAAADECAADRKALIAGWP